MKKMIVIMALFGSYAAAAQYSDFFDNQMKLRKKKEAKQKINPDRFPVLPRAGWKSPGMTVSPNIVVLRGAGQWKLIMQLANGNKVYALPQDNMPCIVPDMNQFNMPDAGNQTHIYRYPAPGAIPNPVISRRGRTIVKNTNPVQ
jgi:hypothetical protein